MVSLQWALCSFEILRLAAKIPTDLRRRAHAKMGLFCDKERDSHSTRTRIGREDKNKIVSFDKKAFPRKIDYDALICACSHGRVGEVGGERIMHL